jgi:hypothetical protein
MATTPVSICNSALIKVGAETILALTDNNERARICNSQYEKNRDELLRAHPWKFATKKISLAPLLQPPEFDYDYAFPIPADCVRVLETDLPRGMDWSQENRKILCNSETLTIRYISKDISTADYDPQFVEVLASKIAADICYSLVQSTTLKQLLIAEYQEKLAGARTFNAQESRGDRVYAEEWLNSRRW